MRDSSRLWLVVGGFALVAATILTVASAQPGGGKRTTETVDEFIAKMMAFDANKDGKLTKLELTDTRLHALFDRADTNKDGIVTREELEALFAKESLPAGGDGGQKGKKGMKKKDAPPPP
jgi:Ca2+-binding EF-hand superfamily protein